tara:strand:+ start:2230 stop:2607 length:378 start_codon:yes stop_codon:yes gene_type:complete
MNRCDFTRLNEQVILEMKKRNGFLMLSATLVIFIVMLSGCDNSESAIDLAKPQVEIKDGDVTNNVQQALIGDEKLSKLNITVLTRKGDVLLTGSVDNQNQINKVNKLVHDTEGVHTLHNHINVQK